MTTSDANGPPLNAAPAGEVAREVLVDARGHRCPVPTLRLRRALEAAGPGALVRLLADDPMARIDVPHFAGEAGYVVVDRGELNAGGLFFVVSRPA
jgi:tRNA 2-thiouridine synthesizing protein A